MSEKNNKTPILSSIIYEMLALALALTLASGCKLESSEPKVVGGFYVKSGQWEAKHTVGIFNGLGEQHCTATRIGKNVLITAAHCLDFPMPEMRLAYGAAILDESGTIHSPTFADKVTILATAIHPLYHSPLTEEEPEDDHNDVGLVYFNGKLPIEITPVADFADFPTSPSELGPFHRIVKVGYGMKGDIDDAIPSLERVSLRVVKIDSDKKEFEFERYTGRGTCSGDSGGPGYIENGNNSLITSITSRGPDRVDPNTGEKIHAPCDEGNGIDIDIRYFRGWSECVANKFHKKFGNNKKGIKPMKLNIEKGDDSAQYCEATIIESFEELYIRVKRYCEDKEFRYDSGFGACFDPKVEAIKDKEL